MPASYAGVLVRVLTIGNRHPPHGVGGYERVWVSLVAHLRARGDEVAVLCTDVREPGVPADAGDPAVRRALRWGWEDGRWATLDRSTARAVVDHDRAVLADTLRAVRPDVVVWMNMGGLPLVLLHDVAAAGVPAVALVHDGWLVYGPDVDPGAGLRRRWQPAPRPPHGVLWVFNSAFVRDRSLSALPPAPDTQVVHPGVDPAVFTPAAPDGPWAGRLLVCGRIAPEKGVDVALHALAELPDAGLTVVGPGAPPEPRPARTRFPGPAQDAALRDAYATSDAVLFPVTWEEPFGLVPLEAMAVGRPVVATGTGGSAEYLRHEENCLLVPPGDAGELAAAVRRLAGDPALVTRLVHAGRATAARFTADGHDRAVAAALDRTAAAATAL